MGKPRITVSYTTGEDGKPDEVRFYMNPGGRDLLVKKLARLNDRDEHLHLQDEEWTIEVPLQMKAYVPERESVIAAVKMMLRLEEWDRQYFPHVLGDEPA